MIDPLKEYPIVIEWSEPDGEYFARLDGLGSFSALGASPEEALR